MQKFFWTLKNAEMSKAPKMSEVVGEGPQHEEKGKLGLRNLCQKNRVLDGFSQRRQELAGMSK